MILNELLFLTTLGTFLIICKIFLFGVAKQQYDTPPIAQHKQRGHSDKVKYGTPTKNLISQIVIL